jgi:hypothetical protein
VVSARSIEHNLFDALFLKFRGEKLPIKYHCVIHSDLSFAGIVLVSYDDETSIEDLITLTDVKSLAQFGNDPATGNSNVDFQFDLPIDAPKLFGGTRYLPGSGVIRGYSYEAPSPGCFSNQRMVEGLCEVSYWIDAEFRLKGQQVGCLTRHVEVSNFYHCLQVSIERPLHFPLKVAGGYFSKYSYEKAVNLSLVLQQVEPRQTVHNKTNGTPCGSLSLGLTLNARNAADIPLSWDTRQSLKCYVDCKWEAKVLFSTIKDQPNMKLERERLAFDSAAATSTERCCVYFRPETKVTSSLYYAAISELDLLVPKFIQEPSYHLGLLSREYTLKVSLAFDKLGGLVLPGIQGVFGLVVKPDEACTDIIGDGDVSSGKIDIDLRHGEETAEKAARCRSPLPLYC